jgi:hypothetical protein
MKLKLFWKLFNKNDFIDNFVIIYLKFEEPRGKPFFLALPDSLQATNFSNVCVEEKTPSGWRNGPT